MKEISKEIVQAWIDATGVNRKPVTKIFRYPNPMRMRYMYAVLIVDRRPGCKRWTLLHGYRSRYGATHALDETLDEHDYTIRL